ncbi:hypothetical protein FBU30_011169 [Linnemannia zychae]|nr:hypothetical protein FBU30_011169 [Linnemannia zychae]
MQPSSHIQHPSTLNGSSENSCVPSSLVSDNYTTISNDPSGTQEEVSVQHATTTATTTTPLKTDFSITLKSESTATLNTTFQGLMDTIHAITPKLSIRGPIRLPKDGKIHSRRIDIRSITEQSLREIGARSGILLAEETSKERIQENGVIVSFDIE